MWENGDCVAPSILVLVAALDEEDGIGLTLAELKKCLGGSRLMVVDGNSRDRTVQMAKNLGAEVLCQEGVGKGDAIGFALRYICNSSFDYVVFTDGDYTYPAEYVPQMIKILEENSRVGMVCGNRFNAKLHLGYMHNVLYFGNRFLALVHNLVNGVKLRDPLTGLRVVRGDIIRNWRPKSTGFDLEVELNSHVGRQGYEIVEIEIPYRPRVGDKKLKLKDGLIILQRILKESIY
jgi:glycosyltransferase involved in cell wall biosynthesis